MKTITKFDLSILIITMTISILIDVLYLKNQNFYYRIEAFLGIVLTTQFLYWVWPNVRLLIKQILEHPRKRKIKWSDESRKPLVLQVWDYSKKRKKK